MSSSIFKRMINFHLKWLFLVSWPYFNGLFLFSTPVFSHQPLFVFPSVVYLIALYFYLVFLYRLTIPAKISLPSQPSYLILSRVGSVVSCPHSSPHESDEDVKTPFRSNGILSQSTLQSSTKKTNLFLISQSSLQMDVGAISTSLSPEYIQFIHRTIEFSVAIILKVSYGWSCLCLSRRIFDS